MDVAAGQLVNTDTMVWLSTSLAEAVGELACILSSTPASYRLLFSEFPDMMNPSGTFSALKHGVEHHIITSGRPVTFRFRRLDPVKLEAAEKEFEQMEADSIIRRSSSCWVSPLHMVGKSYGRELEAMWGLLMPQPCYEAGPVSGTQHGRPGLKPERV